MTSSQGDGILINLVIDSLLEWHCMQWGNEPCDHLRFTVQAEGEEVQRPQGRSKLNKLEKQKEEPQRASDQVIPNYMSWPTRLHEIWPVSASLGWSYGLYVDSPWEVWGNPGKSAFLNLSLLTLLFWKHFFFLFRKKKIILTLSMYNLLAECFTNVIYWSLTPALVGLAILSPFCRWGNKPKEVK